MEKVLIFSKNFTEQIFQMMSKIPAANMFHKITFCCLTILFNITTSIIAKPSHAAQTIPHAITTQNSVTTPIPAASNATATPILATKTANFLAISDIHFDPFSACAKNQIPCPFLEQLQLANFQQWEPLFEKTTQNPSIFGHDSNYALLKSTLQAAGDIAHSQHADFVLILGDSLVHHIANSYSYYFPQANPHTRRLFIKKTLQFLAFEFNKYLPNLSIYPILGNNDNGSQDYEVIANGDFLQDLAQSWKTLLHENRNQNQFVTVFPEAGYYSITPANSQGVNILILDSVLFSTRAANNAAMQQAATKQLRWLETQLQQASNRHERIWLAYHIPMGVNLHQYIRNPLDRLQTFWQDSFTTQFLALLKKYPTPIQAILSAHLHMDAFELITLDEHKKIPDDFVASISPIAGNNPSFKLFTYNTDHFELTDFIAYYLPLSETSQKPHWQQEYQFSQAYQPDCQTNCTLLSGIENVQLTGKPAQALQKYYAANHPYAQPISVFKQYFPMYWCAIKNITRDEYRTCLQQNQPLQKAS